MGSSSTIFGHDFGILWPQHNNSWSENLNNWPQFIQLWPHLIKKKPPQWPVDGNNDAI